MSAAQFHTAPADTTKMTSLGDILRTVFTDAAPCQMCGRRVPTYHDREKDSYYCFPCLEAAVEEAEAEWRAERFAEELAEERQDMAVLACWGRQIAA